jgi:hypothetical protein
VAVTKKRKSTGKANTHFEQVSLAAVAIKVALGKVSTAGEDGKRTDAVVPSCNPVSSR